MAALRGARLLLFVLLLVIGLLPAGRARAQGPIPLVSGSSDAFVEAWVDLTTPWLGQQITYNFRYYEAIDGGNLPSWIRPPDYEAPEFAGFWVEGQPQISSAIEERDGRTYNVAELRTVLFPTAAGSLTIPPATLILYDFFEQGERRLETMAVPVEVRGLPEDAPGDFGGAVGDLTLTAQPDRTTTPTGEPILLRLTLAGEGNLRMAPAPALAALPGWRVFEQGSDVLSEVVNGRGVGTRTFDYMLIPAQAGSVTIPPISLVYFHPESGEFRTTQTLPIVLKAEGEVAEVVASAVFTAPEPSAGLQVVPPVMPEGADETTAPKLASGVQALELRAGAVRVPRAMPPLRSRPIFWALWALPAVALALGVVARRGGGAGASARRDVRRAERSRAHAGSEGRRSLQPPAAFATPHGAAAAAHRVLEEALQRKLARPIAGLSRSEVATTLRAHGATPALAERVGVMLRQGELLRYAPLEMEWPAAQTIHAEITVLLNELDRGLK